MAGDNVTRKEIIDELDFVEYFCSKICLCPNIGQTKFNSVGFRIIYFFILLIETQFAFAVIFNRDLDWLEIINMAPNFGVTLIAGIQYSKVYKNIELYELISNHFRNDIWYLVPSHSEQKKNVVKRYKWIITHFNKFLLSYTMLLILIVNSFPYLVMLYQNKTVGDATEYLYPYDGWYPFDKVKWYWTVYIWEGLMTAMIVSVYAFLSVLHASYIGFICMELKLIGIQLEELITKEDAKFLNNGRNFEEINSKIKKKLKKIISKHMFLACTIQKLDAVLGDTMLLSYSLGAVFICLTAFTSTVVDNYYKSIRYSSMCASLLYEIFNKCLCGQIISDHSEELANAVYFCDWPSASAEIKKMILILIMRTQTPFQITAKGFLPMNMLTFSRICSTSYQLFNVLRTMYA